MKTQYKKKPNFQFYNSVAPGYIETLFLPINFGEWYSTNDLKNILHMNGLEAEGTEIVLRNIEAWSLSGMGESIVDQSRGRKLFFRLSEFGKQIQETYSTNRDLFFDLIHYTFYSAWLRSNDVWRGRFWLYTSVCDDLWEHAPEGMNSMELASKMQNESQRLFSDYHPTFPERGVRSIFPWIASLTPPFLTKCGTKSQLCSQYRTYCTPQLFHLASDLTYTGRQFRYGSSMAVDESIMNLICKTCLLDPSKFFDMADRTQLTIRGFEIRRGQWGTSISLDGPPSWIDLPHLDLYQPRDDEGDE